MSEGTNRHIYNFLDYYTSLLEPEYAVLIDGCWGSGKTWLIRDYFSSRDPENSDHIYVSLYGIKSTEEIERAFFAQLHPKLASKGISIATKIVGGAVKMGSDIFLKTSPGTDGVGYVLQSWLTDINSRILVFDDLERCVMPIQEIMGYINNFVEHGGYKCILLANESEIHKEPDKDHSYLIIKEKLIGQTVTVHADLQAALSAFISEIDSESARATLIKHTDTICEVYRLSEDNNLRILRHAILDVSRVLGALNPDYASNDDLFKILLAQHLVYSIEVRTGRLCVSNIGSVKSEHMIKLIMKHEDNNDDHGADEAVALPEKYTFADLERPLVQEEFWVQLYQHGIIDKELLNQSISESYFFYDSNTPSWQRILDLWSLSNDEFRETITDIKSQLDSKKYRVTGIIKHVYGMLLFLANSNLIEESKADILRSAKEYVDFLAHEGALVDNVNSLGRFPDDDNYAHTQYWGIGVPEFTELRSYIVQSTANSIAASLPQAGEALLREMRDDIALFARRLTLTNSTDNIYYNKPILAYINPDAFVNALFDLNRSNWRTVTSALRERYQYPDFSRQLIDERNWLKTISAKLRERIGDLHGTLDEFRINALLGYLNQCIETIEVACAPGSSE
jgi:hypothetical protein